MFCEIVDYFPPTIRTYAGVISQVLMIDVFKGKIVNLYVRLLIRWRYLFNFIYVIIQLNEKLTKN